MKPARKDGLETKRRLVDTAERLFAETSIDAVTLADVCKEAGQKNRNAAQYHFGDRIGLIHAVLDKHGEIVAQQRHDKLARIEQSSDYDMRKLVEALVLPIADHVHTDPKGLIYLQLNRQLISSSEHANIGLRRINRMSEIVQLQKLIKKKMPPQSKRSIEAKMIIIQCMLFNGLASFYDIQPKTSRKTFVDTLCASITAVLLAESGEN